MNIYKQIDTTNDNNRGRGRVGVGFGRGAGIAGQICGYRGKFVVICGYWGGSWVDNKFKVVDLHKRIRRP